MGAAVLRPRVVVVTLIEGALLAIADGAHAVAFHAERGQEVACRVRAAVAEGEVVLLGALLVAVAFDEQTVLAVPLEPVRRRGQRGLGLGRERRLVVVVERILDVALLLGYAIELLHVARQFLGLHDRGL